MTMALRMISLFALLFALALSPAQAQFSGPPTKVTATLETETTGAAPGDSVTLAFIMRPQPKWHGYWKNGGDAGVGMNLEWDLPAGVTAGELRYPVPTTLILSGLMNYVYEAPYALLVDLKIASNIKPGTDIPIRVNALWLACDDRVCVPQEDILSVTLKVGSGQIDPSQRKRFDGYRAALPVPLDRPGTYRINGKRIELAVAFPKDAPLDLPYFFPETRGVFAYATPQLARRQDNLLVIETGVDEFSLPEFKGDAISGVLRFADGQGLMVTAVKGDIPSGGESVVTLGPKDSATGAAESSKIGFTTILLFSILGGLLLNLMPCVFPILGLKALSLAKMGGEERAARRDALAYSTGVILSVLALGAIMLALRAAGEQVGWAFQLQEPRIVLALLLLMVAVTANLAGLFEVNLSMSGGNSDSRFGSFGTGVLAAIVATPCTGPFMAAAMGAALVLPSAQALLLFGGLGLGLALPYLALAYIPALRKRLPKPGNWLSIFRKAMAIPMALTAVALLWLLWRLSGDTGLLIGGGSLGLLLAVVLLGGRMQRQGKAVLLASLAATSVAAVAILLLPREAASPSSASAEILETEAYSDEKLAEYRAKGRPVFVYFTADWCVTCKINEAAAIQRDDTKAAFEAKNIAVLVGDFTRRDPALARTLARYERSGVPLYLYFPAKGDAQILPQILTPSMLAELI